MGKKSKNKRKIAKKQEKQENRLKPKNHLDNLNVSDESKYSGSSFQIDENLEDGETSDLMNELRNLVSALKEEQSRAQEENGINLLNNASEKGDITSNTPPEENVTSVVDTEEIPLKNSSIEKEIHSEISSENKILPSESHLENNNPKEFKDLKIASEFKEKQKQKELDENENTRKRSTDSNDDVNVRKQHKSLLNEKEKSIFEQKPKKPEAKDAKQRFQSKKLKDKPFLGSKAKTKATSTVSLLDWQEKQRAMKEADRESRKQSRKLMENYKALNSDHFDYQKKELTPSPTASPAASPFASPTASPAVSPSASPLRSRYVSKNPSDVLPLLPGDIAQETEKIHTETKVIPEELRVITTNHFDAQKKELLPVLPSTSQKNSIENKINTSASSSTASGNNDKEICASKETAADITTDAPSLIPEQEEIKTVNSIHEIKKEETNISTNSVPKQPTKVLEAVQENEYYSAVLDTAGENLSLTAPAEEENNEKLQECTCIIL